MFICNNCGDTFSECETLEERHPYGNGYASEYLSVCPCCGSSDFTEAEKCSHCGEYVGDTTEGFCDECYAEMYE